MEISNQIKLEDVFLHINQMKNDLNRLSIEWNKNTQIVFTLNRLISKLFIIEQIIKSYDSLNLKKISNEINSTLIYNPELHGITIFLKKKCCLTSYDASKVAFLNHII